VLKTQICVTRPQCVNTARPSTGKTVAVRSRIGEFLKEDFLHFFTIFNVSNAGILINLAVLKEDFLHFFTIFNVSNAGILINLAVSKAIFEIYLQF